MLKPLFVVLLIVLLIVSTLLPTLYYYGDDSAYFGLIAWNYSMALCFGNMIAGLMIVIRDERSAAEQGGGE